jgi:phage repressor protein C with HTH and peptisase S24 domain
MFDDRPDFAKRLEKARIDRGFKSGRAAAEFFGWKYDSYAQHENGTRGITRAAGKYAKAFRVSEAWLLTGEGEKTSGRQVRLAGFVGAGQEVYQFDDGNAGWVDAPPAVEDGTEAVEVRGESMLPLYEDGTILYYSKQMPPETMIGKRCILRLEDERTLVKTLRRGSEKGLYTLGSLNAPDIEDVGVIWAAPIDWIKP